MEHPDVKPVSICAFATADEFRRRPGYRADVPEPKTRPQRIVGHYRLAEPVHCGVLGCEQLHEHGYVVQLDDRIETNTGWDCGLDHFGFEFVPLRQQYDRAEREYPRRLALRELIAAGDEMRSLIENLQLRPHGGNWLLRNLRRFEELYPVDLLDVLRRYSEKGEAPVAASASPAVSVDIDMEAPPSVVRSSAPHAAVRGLKIFRLDTDRWPLFELELELEEFLQLDADTLSMSQVAHWAHWAETLETRLAELESVIDEGQMFFRRRNLDLLPQLVDDPKSRELMSWIVFSSDFPQPRRGKQPVKNGFWYRNLRRLIIAINQ